MIAIKIENNKWEIKDYLDSLGGFKYLPQYREDNPSVVVIDNLNQFTFISNTFDFEPIAKVNSDIGLKLTKEQIVFLIEFNTKKKTMIKLLNKFIKTDEK